MLSSVEQAFVGRDEKQAPLKTPAWGLGRVELKPSIGGVRLWNNTFSRQEGRQFHNNQESSIETVS